jgi:hypothetical protein
MMMPQPGPEADDDADVMFELDDGSRACRSAEPWLTLVRRRPNLRR